MVMVAGASVLACAMFGLIAAVLSGVKVAVGTIRVVAVGMATLGATYGVGYGFSQLSGI